MPADIVVKGGFGDAFAIVEVHGQVDANSCAVVAGALTRASAANRFVIVDLSQVRLLSAAGLHCLDCVGAVQTEQHGALHLVCPTSSGVREVLRVIGMHDRWTVHAELADAVTTVMRLIVDSTAAADLLSDLVAADRA